MFRAVYRGEEPVHCGRARLRLRNVMTISLYEVTQVTVITRAAQPEIQKVNPALSSSPASAKLAIFIGFTFLMKDETVAFCKGFGLIDLCLSQGHAELNQCVVFRCYIVMVYNTG